MHMATSLSDLARRLARIEQRLDALSRDPAAADAPASSGRPAPAEDETAAETTGAPRPWWQLRR
jgi:hypothetical protein